MGINLLDQAISPENPTNYLLMKEMMLMNCRISRSVILRNIKSLLFFAALGSSQTENEIVKYDSDFEKI